MPVPQVKNTPTLEQSSMPNPMKLSLLFLMVIELTPLSTSPRLITMSITMDLKLKLESKVSISQTERVKKSLSILEPVWTTIMFSSLILMVWRNRNVRSTIDPLGI